MKLITSEDLDCRPFHRLVCGGMGVDEEEYLITLGDIVDIGI